MNEDFRAEGFAVLRDAIRPDHLAMLRRVCGEAVAEIEARMDEAGTDVLTISHRGKRYFVTNRSLELPGMPAFLLSEAMADICRQTIGDNAYLLVEQFVVKCGGGGERTGFEWHQDTGYVHGLPGYDDSEFLTCWCALDDMTEANGTIAVLPFSHSAARVRDHERSAVTNSLVCDVDDPGVVLEVPAGTIVAMSSFLPHRSGENTTAAPRRGYTAHYTAVPLGTGHTRAVALLVDGEYVGDQQIAARA